MNWLVLEKDFRKYIDGDADSVDVVFGALQKYIDVSLRTTNLSTELRAEMVQNILLKLHLSRDRYDPAKPLRAWVVTFVRRTLIDHWRSSKSKYEQADMDLLENKMSDDPGALFKLEIDDLLNQLAHDDKTIVYDHVWVGKNMSEIASSRGMSLPAVKSRYRRALKRLEQYA